MNRQAPVTINTITKQGSEASEVFMLVGVVVFIVIIACVSATVTALPIVELVYLANGKSDVAKLHDALKDDPTHGDTVKRLNDNYKVVFAVGVTICVLTLLGTIGSFFQARQSYKAAEKDQKDSNVSERR